ncbi:MAG: transglycosylase SLT domain-containing protein [bacterium]
MKLDIIGFVMSFVPQRSRRMPWFEVAVAVLLCPALRLTSNAEYSPETGYGPFDRQVQENRQIVANVGSQLEVLPNLMVAVAAAESGFSRNARSSSGAIGIMQLMPPTARETAGDIGLQKYDLEDPFQNALIGGLYLKKMLVRYGGDVSLALAAYNAGPTTVDEWIATSPKWRRGAEIVKQRACSETRGYVHEVIRQSGVDAIVAQRTNSVTPGASSCAERYACLAAKDDTLFSIARRNGIGIRDIWQLNTGKLNLAGDGVIVTPGQSVWLRPLPPGLAVPSRDCGELAAEDVELVVNKAAGYLDLVVSGTPLKRFIVRQAGGLSGAKLSAWDGVTPEGRYYICGKAGPRALKNSLRISYPNEMDAWNALLDERITEGEFDAIVCSLATGDEPPWNMELGGNLCIRGIGENGDWYDGCIVLDDADAEEVSAMTPNGATVVIREDDLPFEPESCGSYASWKRNEENPSAHLAQITSTGNPDSSPVLPVNEATVQ